MSNPQIFKADPKAVDAGKVLQSLTLLSSLPGRHPTSSLGTFEGKTKNTNDRIAFEDDQVSVYEDHLEQKHGTVISDIYFKDITGVEVLRTPKEKVIMYITINSKSGVNVVAGLEKMDAIMAIIAGHIDQGFIKESTMGTAWIANSKKLTFFFVVVVIVLIIVIAFNLNR